MKKLYTVVLALMVLLSLTISAAALETKVIYRENGVGAYASWSENTDGVYTDTFLSVAESDDGTDIYVSIWTYDENTDIWYDKWGYMFTQKDVFNIDNKLESATLSPVEIDLYGWDSETDTWTEETITIEANWTGESDIIKSKLRQITKSDDFMMKFNVDVKYREASATGSIKQGPIETDLGTSDFSELVEFRYFEMYMEK